MIARVQTLPSTLDLVSSLTLFQASFDIVFGLAFVYPLPAGRFFLAVLALLLLCFDDVSSVLPSTQSLNAPLLLSNPSSRRFSLFTTLLSRLPSSRVFPFSCIYADLCSSDPWIKLHPGGRTTLPNRLGQPQCAFVLSVSSTAMISAIHLCNWLRNFISATIVHSSLYIYFISFQFPSQKFITIISNSIH